MSENKKYTEILGWFGFVTFLCGCVAIALPGNPQSIVVGVGFVIAGAGAARLRGCGTFLDILTSRII